MKKLILPLLIIIAFGVSYYVYCNSPNKLDNRLDKVQDQINTYKEQEQKEKLRKIELEALQKPEIITNEFTKVGKLLVYEGTIDYNDIISEKSFWGSKEIALNLKYKCGLSIDLSNIKVVKFIDKTVVLDIPKDKIVLEYLELLNDESKVKSTKSFLVGQFKPEDIKVILDNSKNKTRKEIENNKKIFYEANGSLKETVKNIITELGYEDVIFNER